MIHEYIGGWGGGGGSVHRWDAMSTSGGWGVFSTSVGCYEYIGGYHDSYGEQIDKSL